MRKRVILLTKTIQRMHICMTKSNAYILFVQITLKFKLQNSDAFNVHFIFEHNACKNLKAFFIFQ